MPEVYVADVGMTRFGKREESLTELMYEAFKDAVGDRRPRFDAIFVGCMDPEEFTGDGNIATVMADHFGYAGLPAVRVENAPATGGAVFHQAYFAVASGRYKNVLVLAGEKMSGIPTSKSTVVLSRMLDRYEREMGCTLPAMGALVARAYMHQYGLSREDLAQVSVKNRRNGTRFPYAQFQKETTAEAVMESRMISDPLRLFDCASMCDGAAAAVLTAGDAGEKPSAGPGGGPSARLWGEPPAGPDGEAPSEDAGDGEPPKEDAGGGGQATPRVKVTGVGAGTDFIAVHHRGSLTSLRATRLAADRAYAMAGRGPADVDVAEIHDAFTILEILNSEDLGFFEPGKGGEALVNGVTALDGKLPINPSGGLNSRGHPVGATGLAQICELVWQLRGEAGERQVKGAKVGLTHNIGGFGCNNVVTILEGC